MNTKLYPTKAEIKRLEEIRKRFNLNEDVLTGNIPARPYKKRIVLEEIRKRQTY
jgi:hypothetical protein